MHKATKTAETLYGEKGQVCGRWKRPRRLAGKGGYGPIPVLSLTELLTLRRIPGESTWVWGCPTVISVSDLGIKIRPFMAMFALSTNLKDFA